MPREAGIELEDRRSEIRFPADEDVRLRPEGLLSNAVQGRLLDVAASGFRVQHDSRSLVSGLTVHFEFPGTEGLARVMWTRILDNVVESGFHILSTTESTEDFAADSQSLFSAISALEPRKTPNPLKPSPTPT